MVSFFQTHNRHNTIGKMVLYGRTKVSLSIVKRSPGFRTIEAIEEISIDYGKAYLEQFIKPHGCKYDKCSLDSDE
jgi:hypothetical protein